MSTRRLEALSPETQVIAKRMLDACAIIGIEIIITCTYRSVAEQNILYERGRTAPGKIITWARGGQSLHNCSDNGTPASRAFDVVPIVNGKALWSTKGDDRQIWAKIGAIGESLGAEWGGNWPKGKRDYPHFQLNAEKGKKT